MAYVIEEFQNEEFDYSISVLEKDTETSWDGPIDFEGNFGQNSFTPAKLRKLARWMIERADYIEENYTNTGKKKK